MLLFVRKSTPACSKDYDLGKGIGCTNFNKSAQGSGIIMGEKVGAHVIGMSDIQVHPCGTPGTGLIGNGSYIRP